MPICIKYSNLVKTCMYTKHTETDKGPHIISSNQTAVVLLHLNMPCDAFFQINDMVNIFRFVN